GCLRVALNGQVVQYVILKELASRPDALAGLGRRSGRIGFQSHTGFVWFRNIRVKELLPEAPKAAELKLAPSGFVPLFNGKDLTGWKPHPGQPGNWRVENGVLFGWGAQGSHLYSERGDYKDFYLRIEARINDGGDGGVFLRSRFGPVRPKNNPILPDG